MESVTRRLEQAVDWSAALWAGLIAGTVFLGLMLGLVPFLDGGNTWVNVRLMASVLLGPDVLAPPATFDPVALTAALLAHYGLSLGFGLLLAAVLHRWGLLVGIVGGALMGAGLYFINYYTMTLLFPWFFAMRGTTVLACHVAFGALAGGVYEGLEVEEYGPVEQDD